jgi:hypothetical protein
MVLRARDLGQSTATVSNQGYIDDLNAVASYVRQFRVDPSTGLLVVKSGAALERSQAEAAGRMLVLRSIFTGPEGRDTVIGGFAAGIGVQASRPSLDGVRSLSIGDEAFAVSASFTTNGGRVGLVLVYLRRGRTLGTIVLAGAARTVGIGKAATHARKMATRMAPSSGPPLVA